MGLDMYLEKRISKYRKADGTLSNSTEDLVFDDMGNSNRISITSNVAYWRKANQIHNWFVENVQNGEDDCGEYDVSSEQLTELRDLCKKILGLLDGKTLAVSEDNMDDFANWNKTRAERGEAAYPESVVFSKDVVDNFPEHRREPVFSDFYSIDDETAEAIKELLPTAGGFFFGSTSYGGGYIYDIAKTVYMLDKILSEDNDEAADNGVYGASYTYSASW